MPEEEGRFCPNCQKKVAPKIKYVNSDSLDKGEEQSRETLKIESYFVCPYCGERL